VQPTNSKPPESSGAEQEHAFRTHVQPELGVLFRVALTILRNTSAEDTVMDGLLHEDLEAAVASLDPRFRTVLLLVVVDQLTYAEAADALGVPVGTITSRLNRARTRVRAHLRALPTPPRRTS
jgi:RNA polymerase sigma factor (sigma-70 family)